MTPDEQVTRNLDRAFVLFSDLLENPEEISHIPDGAHVVAMPSDDPELHDANEAMVHRIQKPAPRPGARALADSTLLVNV